MTEHWEDSEDGLLGSMAGRYRLVRWLGEGGMGTVYLGEREEDFRHRAAVKLVLQGVSGQGRYDDAMTILAENAQVLDSMPTATWKSSVGAGRPR